MSYDITEHRHRFSVWAAERLSAASPLFRCSEMLLSVQGSSSFSAVQALKRPTQRVFARCTKDGADPLSSPSKAVTQKRRLAALQNWLLSISNQW